MGDTELFFSASQLTAFAQQVFLALGCPDQQALTAAEILVLADLRGIDSHGVARLPGYVRLALAGRINPRPYLNIVEERVATATIDADAGLGMVAGHFAMALAMRKARLAGCAWVAVRNSNHFGIAGAYLLQAAQAGLVGIAMTNASPLVAPAGGRDRMLGTNPLSFAFPAGRYAPVVADMATTAAAQGKLEILQRKGHEAPIGWVLDSQGQPSTIATATSQGGSLLPLGSDAQHAYHKGYALGAVVDLFSGMLSGAAFGPWVPPFVSFLQPKENAPGPGIGHFFGAIDPEAFLSRAQYDQRMELWVETLKNCAPSQAGQPVLVPGEPEAAMHAQRSAMGIPLHHSVADALQQLAESLRLAAPTPAVA